MRYLTNKNSRLIKTSFENSSTIATEDTVMHKNLKMEFCERC